jgi:TonB-linked SusC/RagA family outer membrane protein
MKKRPLSICAGMERCRLKKAMLTAKLTLLLAALSSGNLMAGDIHYFTRDRIITDSQVIKGQSVAEKVQEVNIRGTVTDANTGEPLPGVNIIVEGTTLGTISDSNGGYSISVPDTEATLLFSFIGYITESITVGDQNVINMQLIPEIKTLDEIVVIGYGTTTRRNFTGSTTSKQIENSPLALIPNTDVMDVLRGVVPGMSVSQQQGAGQSPELLIRGQKSIEEGVNNPLIVLDGIIFMGAIRDIDPSTIESITVLKDAATVAAYGSRAANGVIMINTQRGKIGKPVINFKSSYGISKVINKADVLSPEDWTRKINLSLGLDEDEDPTRWMSDFEDENYENGITTNWQDYCERTGHTQNHSISISGATEKMDYYVSASYVKTKGVLIGDDYDRRAITARLTTDITDWLEVGGNVNFSFNDYSGQTVYDIYQAIRLTPYGRVYRDEEKGLLEKFPATEGLWRVNPLWDVNSSTIDDRDVYYTTILNGHTVIKVPWINGLSYRLNYSYTNRSEQRDNFTHEGFYIAEGISDERYSVESMASSLPNANGYNGRGSKVAWIWDNIINYKRVIGKHNFDVTAVYTRDYYHFNYQRHTGRDFSEMGNTALGYDGLVFAGTQVITSVSDTVRTNIGYLGRINYSFDDKYHLSASVRRDGASVFGADNKWGVFPSVGVAWTLTRESFMNNINPINYLKLKFSWGINGNHSVRPYQTLSTLALGQDGGFAYTFGNTSELYWGQRIDHIGNTYLKWEETAAINGGFELNMFNNRIGLNVDAYFSKTTDQIFPRTIPVMGAGITEIDATMGQIDNKGIEATLNTGNIKNSNFEWNSSLIFYMNRNKLIELYGDGEDDINANLFIGKSLGAIYGYEEIGIIQEEGDEDYLSINIGVPGDVKFRDIDGNDTINEKDRHILGYEKEHFRLSFTNTLKYKNFELYTLITGIFGGKDYYKAINLYAYRSMTDVVWDNNFDHIWWTAENKSNTYPRVNYTNDDFTPLQSRSFVRLQNLSLSYSFNQQWIKKLKIDILKLYISATNLFTITNWEGGDPETGQTLDYDGYGYGYPLSAVYSMGINLTF